MVLSGRVRARRRPQPLRRDHGRTFDAIAHDLGDLEQFAASMARLLRG
jgi:hypothetical protein